MFGGFVLIILMMLGMAADGIDPPKQDTFTMNGYEASTPTPTPTPTQTAETLTEEQRVQQIAQEMGVTVPVYRAQDCKLTPGALACYLPDLDVIFVTDKGMAKGYDYLYCILSHENRHAYQDNAGMIKYGADGSVTNRDFLERDAREAEVCG